jgi:hypothetical protein
MFLSSSTASTNVSFLSGISKKKYINEVKHKSVRQAPISLQTCMRRHKNVAGFNRLLRSQPSPFCIVAFHMEMFCFGVIGVWRHFQQISFFAVAVTCNSESNRNTLRDISVNIIWIK